MKGHRYGGAVLALALTLGVSSRASAQQPATTPAVQPREVEQVREELTRLKTDFETLRRQYDERLQQLEQRLSQLGSGPLVLDPAPALASASAAATPAPQAPATVDQTAGAMPASSSRVFNPDTSVIGNFMGATGSHPEGAEPLMQLSEAEVSFQAVVDPYARADFFLSAGPQGLSVEEGYATFTALPKGLQLKVGKMRAQFGKVNTLHTHAMPTIDRPLVTQNLVGGEDGLSDAGVSLSKLIDNRFAFLEATGEVFTGNTDVFQSTQRSHPTFVGRLRSYRDISEDKNIDVGVSYAYGQTNVGDPAGLDLHKQLLGIDATFRYRPLRRAIYQRLNLRTELIWSRQLLPGAIETTAFGVYGLGEYQFARRWYIGARADRSARPLDGAIHDNGASVFLTFWPSEFAQVRTQYRYTSFAEGTKANELLFQVNFAIGAHGAHLF